MRAGLVQTRTQAKHRGQKGLEDRHITLARVVSEVCGNRGRNTLAGPHRWGTGGAAGGVHGARALRRKRPALELAFTGHYTSTMDASCFRWSGLIW